MKDKEKITNKIKETKGNMVESSALTIMQYWLGYLRALEWVMREIDIDE